MVLLPNIIIDEQMADKIAHNSLNIADRVKLTLANFVAGLLEGVDIFINPQQQDITPPVVFVDFYEVRKSKRLLYTSQYEFGFTISYIPKDVLSRTEQTTAEFILLQNITDIASYKVLRATSDTTDGIVNIIGLIKVNEKDVDTAPIIIIATPIITDKIITNIDKELIT